MDPNSIIFKSVSKETICQKPFGIIEEMIQTSTEKGSLELLYLCPFPQPLEFNLWPLGGPKRQNHPKILRKTVANEGSEVALGQEFHSCIWRLVVAVVWETLLVEWHLWLAKESQILGWWNQKITLNQQRRGIGGDPDRQQPSISPPVTSCFHKHVYRIRHMYNFSKMYTMRKFQVDQRQPWFKRPH